MIKLVREEDDDATLSNDVDDGLCKETTEALDKIQETNWVKDAVSNHENKQRVQPQFQTNFSSTMGGAASPC